jgi:hypothetical protein
VVPVEIDTGLGEGLAERDVGGALRLGAGSIGQDIEAAQVVGVDGVGPGVQGAPGPQGHAEAADVDVQKGPVVGDVVLVGPQVADGVPVPRPRRGNEE